MLRAVVLGEPGAGSTTFLGLLYAAQVRLGSDRGDRLRFFAPPESLAFLSGVYQRLMTGEFPEPTADGEAARVRIELAFRPEPRMMDRFRHPPGFSAAGQVEIRWVRSALHGLAEALEGKSAPGPGIALALAECDAPVFILRGIPGIVGPAGPTGTEEEPGTSIVRLLRWMGSSMQGQGRTGPRPIHPIFVFTKVDAWPAQALARAGLTGPLTEDLADRDRSRWGPALLASRVPAVMEYLRSVDPTGAPPGVFYSCIGSEDSPDGGIQRLRLRTTPEHYREPEYPFAEYRALLGRLGELARG